MTGYGFSLHGSALTALPSGALWDPTARLLCVSDLHLGKSDRIARRSGRMLPPYETHETLGKLAALITEHDPAIMVCLGDSFDDLDAVQSLDDAHLMQIAQMQAGRDWVWIEGNHDPGPVNVGGRHLAELSIRNLTYRHIAEIGNNGEVSGHYHPKCTVRGTSRPAFLIDRDKVIMPAFGTYTGGLRSTSDVLKTLIAPNAIAVLTGRKALPVPFKAVS